MKKFKVLVDMDDTMENLLVCWLNRLNKKHGTNVAHHNVHSWDMCEFFPSLSKKEVFAPLHDETLWDEIEPIKGSVQYLKRLIEDGHEIYVVTASHYNTVKPKIEKVLFKYFPFISWDNVIITSNKQMIKGDILIDDAPHNLVDGGYFKILMDAPHNQGYSAENNGMVRVYNWEEIYKLITRLSLRK